MSKRDLYRIIAVIIFTLLIYSNDNLNRLFEQDWLQYANYYMLLIGIMLVAVFYKIFHLLKSIERWYNSLYEQYHDMYIKLDDLKDQIADMKSNVNKTPESAPNEK